MTFISITKLGFWYILSVVIGGLLGVSIISVPQQLAELGTVGYFTWFAAMPAILALALMFGRLSAMYPGGGGPYGYACAILGWRYGRVVGTIHLLAMLIQQAAVVVILQEAINATGVLFGMSDPVLRSVVCALMVICCGIVQMARYSLSVRINVLLNIAKLAPFVLLTIFYIPEIIASIPAAKLSVCNVLGGTNFGFAHFDPKRFEQALILIMFAFGGLEFSTVTQTDEVHEPTKTIPNAIYYGTLLSGIAFFLLQLVASVAESYPPVGFVFTVARLLLAWCATAFGIITAAHLLLELDNKPQERTLEAVASATAIPLVIALVYSHNSSFKESFLFLVAASDLAFAVVFLICACIYTSQDDRRLLTWFAGVASSVFLYASFSWAGIITTIAVGIGAYIWPRRAPYQKTKTIKEVLKASGDGPIFIDLDLTLLETTILWDLYRKTSFWNRLKWSIQWLWLSRLDFMNVGSKYLQSTKLKLNFRGWLVDELKKIAKSRPVVLATGASKVFADLVIEKYPFFSDVISSDRQTCRVGKEKLGAITEMIEEKGWSKDFMYIGDSAIDLQVWSGARYPVVVAQESNAQLIGRWTNAIHGLVSIAGP